MRRTISMAEYPVRVSTLQRALRQKLHTVNSSEEVMDGRNKLVLIGLVLNHSILLHSVRPFYFPHILACSPSSIEFNSGLDEKNITNKALFNQLDEIMIPLACFLQHASSLHPGLFLIPNDGVSEYDEEVRKNKVRGKSQQGRNGDTGDQGQ